MAKLVAQLQPEYTQMNYTDWSPTRRVKIIDGSNNKWQQYKRTTETNYRTLQHVFKKLTTCQRVGHTLVTLAWEWVTRVWEWVIRLSPSRESGSYAHRPGIPCAQLNSGPAWMPYLQTSCANSAPFLDSVQRPVKCATCCVCYMKKIWHWSLF